MRLWFALFIFLVCVPLAVALAVGGSVTVALKVVVGALADIFSVPRALAQALFGWGAPHLPPAPPGRARQAATAAFFAFAPAGSVQRTYAFLFVPAAVVLLISVASGLLQLLGMSSRVERVWREGLFVKPLLFVSSLGMFEDALARARWGASGQFTLTHVLYAQVANFILAYSNQVVPAPVARRLFHGVSAYLAAAAFALVMSPRTTASATCSWVLFGAGCIVAVVTTNGLFKLAYDLAGLKLVTPLGAVDLFARKLIEFKIFKFLFDKFLQLPSAAFEVFALVFDGIRYPLWLLTDLFMRHVYYPLDLFVLWPLEKALYWFLHDVLPAIARAMTRALATTFRFVRDTLVVPTFRFVRDTLVDKILVPGAKMLFPFVEPVLATVAAWEFASAATKEPTAYHAAPFAAATVAAASVALMIVGRKIPTPLRPVGAPLAAVGLAVFLHLDASLLPVLRRAVIWTYRAVAFVLGHLYNFFAAIAAKLSAAFAAFMDTYVWPVFKRIRRMVLVAFSRAIEDIWASPALAALASASVLYALVEAHRANLGERLAQAAASALSVPAEHIARRCAGPLARAGDALGAALLPLLDRAEEARAFLVAAALSVDAVVATGSPRAMFRDEGFAWLVYGAVTLAGALTDVSDVVARVGRSGNAGTRRATAARREALAARAEIGARVALKASLVPALFGAFFSLILSPIFGLVGVGWDRLFSLVLAASSRVYVGVVVLVVGATQWRAQRDIADLADGGGGGARVGNEMVANEIVHDAIARPPARCFEGDTCVVCVEALADASATDVDEAKKEELAAVWLPCGHGFHKACITEWLKRRTLCPTCRQDPCASSIERVAI